MVHNNYARAYTEVLEILSHFSKENFKKIPAEKINYYKENMDKSYDFKIDPKSDLSGQNISIEANAILVNLFIKYYATEEQKIKIKEILDINKKRLSIDENQKKSSDDLFISKNITSSEINRKGNTSIILKKETVFSRFINYLKNLFLFNKKNNK